MKKRHHELEVLNFWPGYVDALINVVLNLLFMVAIFAVGVFCMGLQAQLHPKGGVSENAEILAAQEAGASAGTKDAAKLVESLGAKGLVAPFVFRVQGRASALDPAAAGLAEQELIRVVSGGKKSLTVNFLGSQNALTGDINEALSKEVDSNMGAQGIWKVWATTSGSDPNERRELYMRMTGVRGGLIRAKVDPQNIEMDLYEGSPQKNGSRSQVHLFFKQQ